MANLLLINAPGRPSNFAGLGFDNGLYSLAAILKSDGHQAQVLDLCSVSAIRGMTSPGLRAKISEARTAANTILNDQFERGRPSTARGWARHLAETAQLGVTFMVTMPRLQRQMDSEMEAFNRAIACTIEQRVKREGIQGVGFKGWLGESVDQITTISNHLRSTCPQLFLFEGGPAAKYFPKAVLWASPALNCAAVGDGEKTILALANYLDRGGDPYLIPNLFLRTNQGVGLRTPQLRLRESEFAALPFPEYDVALAGTDRPEKVLRAIIEDRRGCHGADQISDERKAAGCRAGKGCNFCGQCTISGKEVRRKPAERGFEEMRFLHRRQGFNFFGFGGSTADFSSLLEIAGKVRAEQLPVHWNAFLRTDGVDHSRFGELKAGGLEAVFYGAESGDQTVLDEVMNKGVTVEQTRLAIRAAVDAGLFVAASLISPAPLGAFIDYRKTPKQVVAALQEIDDASFNLVKESGAHSAPTSFPGIYPGTAWAEDPLEYGFEIRFPNSRQQRRADRGEILPANYYYREIQDYALRYRILLSQPPIFWASRPWLQNGMGSKMVAKWTLNFAKRLMQAGIAPNISDETAILARAAGMDPLQFSRWQSAVFLDGDADAIEEVVAKVNASK